MHPTVAANAQHRMDDATGTWKRVGAGRYENYDGWTITKERGGWVIYRPNGEHADDWVHQTLTVAKHEAAALIRKAADTRPAAPASPQPGPVAEGQDVPAGTRVRLTRTWDPKLIARGDAADVTIVGTVESHRHGALTLTDVPHNLRGVWAAPHADDQTVTTLEILGDQGRAEVIEQPVEVDPVAVDTTLAELYQAGGQARQRYSAAAERARHLVGERKVSVGRSRVWQTSDVQAIENLQAVKDAGTLAPWDVTEADRALAMATQADADHAAAQAQAEPLRAVYDQHGWSRFFSVPGGHIHSGMRCQGGTIRVRTQVEWNPNLSGLTEEDAVKALGPHLCTHCFPSAPLDWTRDPKDKAADPDTCASVELTEAQRSSINWQRVYKTVVCECTAEVSVTSTGRKRKHKRGDRTPATK